MSVLSQEASRARGRDRHAPFARAGLLAGGALLLALAAAVYGPRPGLAATVTWTEIGRSLEGRPLRAASFGSGSRHVLYVGGVHGDECGTDVAQAFALWLAGHPGSIPRGTRIDVIACVDPDGRTHGTPYNARGVDLNRNFPSSDWRPAPNLRQRSGRSPGSEPETKAVLAYLGRGYARVVSLHSTGPLMDYDGPGSAPLAQAMATAAKVPLGHLSYQASIHGSMGRYIPERYRIPIITWELTSRTMTANVLAGLIAGYR